MYEYSKWEEFKINGELLLQNKCALNNFVFIKYKIEARV